jgi:hypothetical protein
VTEDPAARRLDPFREGRANAAKIAERGTNLKRRCGFLPQIAVTGGSRMRTERRRSIQCGRREHNHTGSSSVYARIRSPRPAVQGHDPHIQPEKGQAAPYAVSVEPAT